MNDSISAILMVGGLVLASIVLLRSRNNTPTSITYGDVNTVELIGNEFGGDDAPAWHDLIPSDTTTAGTGTSSRYSGGSASTWRTPQPP